MLLVVAALPATLGPGSGHSLAQVAPSTPPAWPSAPPPFPPIPPTSPAPTPDPTPAPLTLDMAVGQMMAASFAGPTITEGLRRLILDQKVGTVLIFGDNFTDAASLRRLTAQLQRLGRDAGLPAPLLVAVDEEGGRVMRIHDGVAALPSELALGAGGPQAVRQAAADKASGLHGPGIQLNLAPGAALRSDPADAVIRGRSRGGDPGVVGPLVAAAVDGLHDGGV